MAGTLQVTSSVSLANGMTVNVGGGTIDTQANTVTLTGTLTGSGDLNVTSSTTPGTLILDPLLLSAFSGGLNILNGTVQIGTPMPWRPANTVTLGTASSNGTLDLHGFNQTSRRAGHWQRCQRQQSVHHQQRHRRP